MCLKKLGGIAAIILGTAVPSYALDLSAHRSPQAGYVIQLGAHDSETQARDFAQGHPKTAEATLHVISARDESQRSLVVKGPFNTYMEAFLERERLRSEGVDCFVKKLDQPEPALAGKEALASKSRVFPSDRRKAADHPLRNLQGNSEYHRLEQVEKSLGDKGYREELTALDAATDESEPLKGYIKANLGSIAIREGKLQEAKEHLGPVARGEVEASAAHRLMAMRRYAWTIHQLGDRVEAYQAYKAVEEFTDSEPVRLTAQVEQLGLLFELSESGKGTHEEVRQEMLRFLDEAPENAIKSRAVVELMFLETFARQKEKDYQTAIGLGEDFMKKYPLESNPTLLREIATAHYQIGHWYFESNKYDEALKVFQDVIDTYPDESSYFAGFHPHSEALLGISNCILVSGDITGWRETVDFIMDSYPETEAARRLTRLYRPSRNSQ